MIKNKTTKPSTKVKKAAKKQKSSIREEFEVSPWLEDYLDCFHLKYKPVTEAFLERISRELITWAKTNDKAYRISQFFSAKNMSYQTYTDWAKKYPSFGAAYNLSKTIIGERRESGALERKLDAGTVIQMMPSYCPEWKQMVKERSDMKAIANEKNSGGTQFIVMDKFGSSDLVPTMKTQVSKTQMSKVKGVSMSKAEPPRTPEEVAGEVTMMSNDKMLQENN
jgi:hypothetical protein